MFTGIIEETGSVLEMRRSVAGARLVVAASEVLTDLALGGSVSVNGCCLTAVSRDSGGFAADLSPETLAKTNLGDLEPGSTVNLERPLLPTGRLSGHFVLGHVDGTGRVEELDPVGDGNWWLRVRVPDALAPLLVYKGSVAVDGVSLTVASLQESVMGIAIIPHTYEATSLKSTKPGDAVNIECDVLAKHVQRLLALGGASPAAGESGSLF